MEGFLPIGKKFCIQGNKYLYQQTVQSLIIGPYDYLTFWVTWFYNMNQGTLLDLHGPLNGPCDADFGGALTIKCHPGFIQIDYFI